MTDKRGMVTRMAFNTAGSVLRPTVFTNIAAWIAHDPAAPDAAIRRVVHVAMNPYVGFANQVIQVRGKCRG